MTGDHQEKSRYLVTAAFTVNTPGGSRTFTPGAVLSLVPEKAAPFILAGQLREVAPDPDSTPQPNPGGGLLIPWRTATGRLIYLAESPTAAAHTPPGAAVFQLAELDLIREASPATLNLIINTKEIFDNPLFEPLTLYPLHGPEVSRPEQPGACPGA